MENSHLKHSQVFLSLGSNVDDRMAHIASAEEKLENHPQIEIVKKSQIYETEPWPLHDVDDSRDRPHKESGELWFLNQVVQIKTDLDPQELLEFIESAESDMGRSKKHNWESRTIDIDILLYGNDVIESDALVIPHRHMNDREFILVPLLEIAPELKDPLSGKDYKTLLKKIVNNHKVTPYF